MEYYDLHLQELIDEQLTFEELKRITRVKGHDRLDLPFLQYHYAKIEDYLNTVVREYEQRRYRVASGEILDAAAFPRLQGFLKQRDDPSRGLVGFHTVSDEVNEITAQIRTSLMKELYLPDVDVSSPLHKNPFSIHR